MKTLYKTVESLDSGWTDAYGNGTVSHDSTTKIEGTASIKVLTSSDGFACGMKKSLGRKCWQGENFKFFVRSSDWENVGGCQILIADSTITNFFYINLKDFFQDFKDDEWYEIVLTRSQMSSYGTPLWNTSDTVIFRGWSDNGETPIIYFDDFKTFDEGGRGFISISFDDGWSSQYSEAYTYMNSLGLEGSMFIIPSLVGDTGRITQSNIDTLNSANWEISGHGETDLTTLTSIDAEEDVSSAKNYLTTNNYNGKNIFAYPNGQNNNSVRNIVGNYFNYSRTINYINQSLGYISNLRISAFSPINTTPVSTIQDYVDKAIENNEWLILTFHKIVETPSISTEYSISNFRSVIDYIDSSTSNIFPIEKVLQLNTIKRNTVQISANSDDGHCNNAASPVFSNNNNWVTIGRSGTNYYSGFFRFNDIKIPKDSTIESCKITFQSVSNQSGSSCNVDISFCDEDNALAPTNVSSFNDKPLTTVTSWNSIPSWTTGVDYDTPDLKNSLQEVVNRSGWSDGNSVVAMFINNNSGSSAYRQIKSHDGHPSVSAIMKVTYSPPQYVGSSERSMYVHGIDTTFAERSLYLIGSENDSAERNIYLKGIGYEGVERNIFLSGVDTGSSERGLYLSGKDVSSSDVNLYLSGEKDTFAEFTIWLSGKQVVAERLLYLSGKDLEQKDTNIYLSGKDTHTADLGLYLSGKNIGSQEFNIYLTGAYLGSAERLLWLRGSQILGAERNLYLVGCELVGIERSLYLSGKDTTYGERSIYLLGIDSASAERNIYLQGSREGSAEFSIYLTGSIYAEFSIYLIGAKCPWKTSTKESWKEGSSEKWYNNDNTKFKVGTLKPKC